MKKYGVSEPMPADQPNQEIEVQYSGGTICNVEIPHGRYEGVYIPTVNRPLQMIDLSPGSINRINFEIRHDPSIDMFFPELCDIVHLCEAERIAQDFSRHFKIIRRARRKLEPIWHCVRFIDNQMNCQTVMVQANGIKHAKKLTRRVAHVRQWLNVTNHR